MDLFSEVAVPVCFAHINDYGANIDLRMLFKCEVGLLSKFLSGAKSFEVIAKRIEAKRGAPS